MSLYFHPLTIGEVRQETADCVSLLLLVPDELKEIFHFQQGQHVSLKKIIEGQELRRSYSICSSPLDGELRIAIKKVEGGVFSQFANEKLKAGDTLEVMPPSGKFNSVLHPGQKKQYLAIAAGSGITPVLSLIRTTLATEPGSEFTLIYGNRQRSSILFFEQLEAVKSQFMERFSLTHILSRERTDSPLHFGRINEEKLEDISRMIAFENMDEAFICGPQEMTEISIAFLEKKGIDRKKIHAELFTSASHSKKTNRPKAENSSTAVSKVSIRVDGRQLDIEMPLKDDQTILDAALQQGADLPFACKGGMCCTCKAKLLEGEVSMDVHWGLEEEEIKQGYILTCQSHPKTERIIVDFDSK